MLHVVHGTMIDSAIEIRRTAEDVEAERAVVARQADTLFSGGWTGPAASSFRDALAEWDHGAAQVIRALQHMGDLVASVSRDFQTEDARDAVALRAAGRPAGHSGLNL